MDPNANLQELVRLIASNPLLNSDEHDRIMELADALFNWLVGGGFKPQFIPMPFPEVYLRSLFSRTYHIFTDGDSWEFTKYDLNGAKVASFTISK